MMLAYLGKLPAGRPILAAFVLWCGVCVALKVTGQSRASSKANEKNITDKTVYVKKGYSLTFINKSGDFDTDVRDRLVRTFFRVYPREAHAFNRRSARKVTFIIDPDYKGVAATSGTTVRYNPLWFKAHPEDIDVVTHEAMHIVQAYHSGYKPGWLVEGIADYVRYVYGVNNKAAGWTLPDYNPKQSYKNAYRITARFLVWVNTKYGKSVVKKLDAALRGGRYKTRLWEQITGHPLDALWKEYGENPVLRLNYR